MKKLKIEFPQKITRYSVITDDPITGTRLETTRDKADISAGLYIGEESEFGRGPGRACEEARMAHIRALKKKWPNLTDRQLSTTKAASGAGETEEKRIAFVRQILKSGP